MPEFISIREFARRESLSDTLVRRAIKQGRLTPNAEGKLDATLVGTGWCERNVRRLDDGAAASTAAANSANSGANSANTAGPPIHGEVSPTPGAELLPDETPEQAAERIAALTGHVPPMSVSLARKEFFLSLKHELQYREALKQMIPLEHAQAVMFDCGRAARDHWANFVAKHAALIAAELGCEADRVTEVLTGYVHKHAAALGDSEPAEFVRPTD